MLDGVEIPGIGPLSLLEVYVEYDGPRVFACGSQPGQVYIATCTEVSPSRERWLLFPTSKGRWVNIRRGNLSLRDAILNAEGGSVHNVMLLPDGSIEHTMLGVTEVPADDLPGQRSVLHLESGLPFIPMDYEDDDPIQWVAAASVVDDDDRGVLRLDFDTKQGGHEIETEHLGWALVRLQSLIRSFGAGPASSRVRLPRVAERGCTLLTTAFAPGSFEVRLRPEEQASFLDSITPTEVAIAQFMDVWGTDRVDDAVQKLRLHGPKTARRFSWLVRALVRARVSVTARWCNSQGKRASKRKLYPGLEDLLSVLSAEEPGMAETFHLHGVLVGIDFDRNRFHFIEGIEGRNVFGELSADLQKSGINFEKFRMPGPVTITVEERLSVRLATGEEYADYTLIAVDLLQHPTEGAEADAPSA